MSSLHVSLVSPERTLYQNEARRITCHTAEGIVTILPHHTPLITALVPGELEIISLDGDSQHFHVGGGFIEVQPGSAVAILAEVGERVAEIDEARAAEALRLAKERLEREFLSDREYAAVASLIERNAARLRIVRKHAHRRRASITSEGVLEE